MNDSQKVAVALLGLTGVGILGFAYFNPSDFRSPYYDLVDFLAYLLLVLVVYYAVERVKGDLVSPWGRSVLRRKQQPKGMSKAEEPRQVKIGNFFGLIPVEMTRIREVVDQQGKEAEYRRVTIRKGAVRKTSKLFKMKTGVQSMKEGVYLVDLSCLTKDGKLLYDVDYSEPIDPDTGQSKFSEELDLLMAGAFATQGIEIATFFAQFAFNRQYLIVMGLAILIGVLPILSLDPIFHFNPTTVIHWVTSAPRVIP